ncbi:hypothetical protein A33M_4479 [Rhodovulum sp. PH10]|nr:hypothetical protein A33M_4479 [Rhodovulum sp. PH10]
MRVGAPLPQSSHHRETAVETALDSVAFLRRSVHAPARSNHEQRPER